MLTRSRTFSMRLRGGIALRGWMIAVKGKIIVKVCSSTWSPYQECGVVLVRIDDPEMGPDTEVFTTGTDGNDYSAQICSLPLYYADGAIIRGKDIAIPDCRLPRKG